MQWLKDIFEKADIKEDNSINIENLIADIKKEIEKNTVSKSDYENIKTELETVKSTILERDKQLTILKKSAGDNEELKKQITELETANKRAAEQYESEINSIKINNVVEKALIGARAKNSAVIMPLLSDFLKTAELDEKGTIKGLDKIIDKLTKDESSSFLFESSENNRKFEGITPIESGENNTAAGKGVSFAQRYNAQFNSAN